MNSTRILLSDRHFHDLRLSEQQIGVAVHALVVLGTAFDEESDYLAVITDVLRCLRESIDRLAVPDDYKCQKCGKTGGKVVSFQYDSIKRAIWICPHCVDAAGPLQEKK